MPVSQRQPGPIRQRRAALRTLAAPSPAGSTLTTSTAGRSPAGSDALNVADRPPTSGQSERQRESRNVIRVTRPRVEASDTLPPSTSRRVNGGAGRFPAAHVAWPWSSGRPQGGGGPGLARGREHVRGDAGGHADERSRPRTSRERRAGASALSPAGVRTRPDRSARRPTTEHDEHERERNRPRVSTAPVVKFARQASSSHLAPPSSTSVLAGESSYPAPATRSRIEPAVRAYERDHRPRHRRPAPT